MSLEQTQDALDNDQQSLQQKAGMGDMFAMIKLYKMVKDGQQKQMAQGLAAQQQPPVKAQLIQAAMGQVAPAAPAPPSGIAMAAGGIVRHFDGSDGSVPLSMPDAPDNTIPGMVTGTPYSDAMASVGANDHQEGDIESAFLKVPRAIRDLIYSGTSGIQNAAGNPTWEKLGQGAQDLYTEKGSDSKQAAAKAAARVAQENPDLAAQLAVATGTPGAYTKPNMPLGIGTQGPTAAQLSAKLSSMDKPNPKVTPDPTPAGLAAAAQSKTPTPSGPPNATKVDAASEDQPADTPYMDAADEYLKAKKPLDDASIQIYKDKLQAGQTAHDAYLAAKQANPWEKVIAILHPYVEANGNKTGLGNMGTLAEGSYNLMRNQQAEKLANAKSEEEYQARQLGIQAGLTDAQLHQLMGNFTTTNNARAADDKTELNSTKMDNAAKTLALNQARLDETKRKDNAYIAKTTGAGGAGASMKGAMTPAQYGQLIEKHITNAMNNRGLTHEEALAEAKTVVPPIGTPVALQSNAPAPASTGDLQSAAAAEIARRAANH